MSLQEGYNRISEWNRRVGNTKPFKSDEHFFNAVMKQADLVVEESKETSTAALDYDELEVLDGVCDVLFTGLRLAQLLDKAGYDVFGALLSVCDNNDLKYSTSYDTVEEWAIEIQESKGIEVYIHSFESSSGTYYCVKDKLTDKVLKSPKHPKVDLSAFIPN